MSDFFTDLEAELLDAGRRRASGARRPARRGTGGRALAVTAVVAAVAAALVAAVASTGPTTSERMAGANDAFPLPVYVAFDACRAPDGAPSAPPDSLRRLLGLVRRAPVPVTDDPARFAEGVDLPLRIPALASRADVRRAGSLLVVPTRRLQVSSCPAAVPSGEAAAGACVVASGAPPRVACFTEAQIRGGRAVALLAADRSAIGLVPDGVGQVELVTGTRRVSAKVVDNTVRIPASDARVGDPVRLRFSARRTAVAAPTVAVLNGTTVPGTAARIADRLIAAGVADGNGKVDTFTDQTVAASRVVFVRGAEREARDVARVAGVDVVRRGSAGELALGDDAPILVVVGSDLATPPGRGIETVAGLVAFVDATGEPAGRVLTDLDTRLKQTTRFSETLATVAEGPGRTESRVLYRTAGGQDEAVARRVAQGLGIGDVASARGDVLGRGVDVRRAAVVVVVGRDRLRPAPSFG